jgi:DNA processing protein
MTPYSAEQRDLLALTLVPGLGPKTTFALIEHFGAAAAVRAASFERLLDVPGVGEKLAGETARALRAVDVDAEIGRMNKAGVWMVASTDERYPSALLGMSNPPPLLYGRGEIMPIDQKAVAIVGSRQCTPYGRGFVEKLAGGLARAGFTVVSGLARGIDGVAHQAALASGGRTIAVLAGGLSSIYPPEHADLADAIAGRGALVSETPMAMKPQRGMFHARNRLISGLARAVVIVEANDRSGALITARHAAEQGRDVFAAPANADSIASAGSLALLRDGARLIRGIDDLLEDLSGIPAIAPFGEKSDRPAPDLFSQATRPEGLDELSGRIWDALETSLPVDQIARGLDVPIGELTRTLMSLELKRVIRRLPGNFYERRS